MSREPERISTNVLGRIFHRASLIPLIALLVSIASFILGRGFVMEQYQRPQLVYSTDQIITDNFTISSCTLTNQGRKNATDVSIQMDVAKSNSLIKAVEVDGSEENWEIEAGVEGESVARVISERLAPNDYLKILITTEAPEIIRCRGSSFEDSAVPEVSIANSADYGFLATIGSIVLIWIVFFLYLFYLLLRNIRSQIPPDTSSVSHEDDESDIELDIPEKDALDDIDRQVYQYNKNRYGIGYSSLEIQVSISGEDGSAEVERKVVLQAEEELKELDTILLVAESQTDKWDLKFVKLINLSKEYDITIERKRESRRISNLIRFSPALQKGETATFILQEWLPQNFYKTNPSGEDSEEIEKFKHPEDDLDGFGWNINRPTCDFSVHVFFPSNWIPRDIQAKVLIATASGFPSSREQIKEKAERLVFKRDIVGGSYHLHLAVKYPMPGLNYLITWRRPLEPSRLRNRIGAKER